MIYSAAESGASSSFCTLSAHADDESRAEFCLESVDRPCGTNQDQIRVFPNRVIKHLRHLPHLRCTVGVLRAFPSA